LAISKILEKPQAPSCLQEVAELTQTKELLGTAVFAPMELMEHLRPAFVPETKVELMEVPYITVAGLGADTHLYVKVLVDSSASESSPELEQLKSIMHKDENQCSLNGKDYDIYRTKTLLPQETSFPL
jgi:hypothetical protein